jgi:hypothetical protein
MFERFAARPSAWSSLPPVDRACASIAWYRFTMVRPKAWASVRLEKAAELVACLQIGRAGAPNDRLGIGTSAAATSVYTLCKSGHRQWPSQRRGKQIHGAFLLRLGRRCAEQAQPTALRGPKPLPFARVNRKHPVRLSPRVTIAWIGATNSEDLSSGSPVAAVFSAAPSGHGRRQCGPDGSSPCETPTNRSEFFTVSSGSGRFRGTRLRLVRGVRREGNVQSSLYGRYIGPARRGCSSS